MSTICKSLCALAVLAAASSAFAGEAILIETNAGLDRNNLGGWTFSTGATRDNIAANGDTWLFQNSGHFNKEVYGANSGTTAGAGFVGTFGTATGDTVTATYVNTIDDAIAAYRPVRITATVAPTIVFQDNVRRGYSFNATVNGNSLFASPGGLAVYFSNGTAVQAGDLAVGAPTGVFDDDVRGRANPTTMEVTSGWTTGLTAAANDNITITWQRNPFLGGQTSNPRHVAGGIGNIVVELAFQGDADLNNSVDVGDLGVLASNWSTVGGATWATGDWNGDGNVDVGDLGLLASNWNASGTTSLSFSEALALFPNVSAAVPEPASLGLLAIGALGLLRRRK